MANPGAQAWKWVGGQKYDQAIQVRINCAGHPTHGLQARLRPHDNALRMFT